MVRNAFESERNLRPFGRVSGAPQTFGANNNGANSYEVPPRFRKQQGSAKGQLLQPKISVDSEKDDRSASSTPQGFRRKTARSPLQFEDFLPPEHRRSANSTPDSGNASTTGQEISNESGFEKFERPPRFQKPDPKSTIEATTTPKSGLHHAGKKPFSKPHPRVGRNHRSGHFSAFAGPAHHVPIFLPAPASYFAGTPAVQFLPNQVPIPQFPMLVGPGGQVIPPGLDYYAQVADHGLLVAPNGMPFGPGGVFCEGAVPPGMVYAPQTEPAPLRATENFVYQPPEDSDDEKEEPEAQETPKTEFRFPNRKRSDNVQPESSETQMDFSWEKFCEAITTRVNVDGENSTEENPGEDGSFLEESSFLALAPNDDSGLSSSSSSAPNTGTNTPELANSPGLEGGQDSLSAPVVAQTPMAVPVFAKSPPASDLPLPPIDWLSVRPDI